MSFLTDMFSLAGKTALITGGTRGIGHNMASALAQAGASVILLQRNTQETGTYDEIKVLSPKSIIVECDVSSTEAIKAAVQLVTKPKADGGKGLVIDILVNCAGIQRRSPSENFSDEDWSDVLQVNLTAVWTLCREVGRHMIDTGTRGKIINVASLLSYQGGLTVPAYAAAKHGVAGLTKALSNEWSSKGINVNAIAPGYIETDMNSKLLQDPTRLRQITERIPAGRWGQPKDFEGVIVFLASKASDYVCGETIIVDGGWMGR